MSNEPAWWYANQGKSVGPLGLKELKLVLSRRSNARETFVWTDGFSEWKRAGDVSALNGSMVNVRLDINTLMDWRMGSGVVLLLSFSAV